MKRIGLILCLFGITVFSCVKSDEVASGNPVDGDKVGLAVKFGFTPEGAEDPYTDVPQTKGDKNNVVENLVRNVWLFQFDGTTDQSLLVMEPQYITAFTAPIQFVTSTVTNRIVAIGNTGNINIPWDAVPGVTRYADLKSRFITLNGEEDTYMGNALQATGMCDVIVKSGAILNFTMYRSLAKLVFNISNQTLSGQAIKSVQLCNVPARLDVFAGLTTHTTVYPVPNTVNYMDFVPYEVNMPAGSAQSRSIVYYIPRNEQGTIVNNESKYKNSYAPDHATYFKIMAADAAGNITVFKFYPGANMTNDFNLKPNTKYGFNFTIDGKGDAVTDGRVEDYSTVNMQSKPANSYILNPPPPGSSYIRKYQIYPEQVNLFWGSEYENVAASQIGRSGNSPKAWGVDLIWMDTQDLVTAAAGDGNIQVAVQPNTKGDDMYFELQVPETARKGNFVMALYRDFDENGKKDSNEPYLWSWHFWVTDYNPDNKTDFQVSTYALKVPGGSVHRYAGTAWVGSGVNADALMMDRYLGEVTPETAVSSLTVGVLHYQYGRKDPFPATSALYDITGKTVNVAMSAGGTITGTMGNPFTFYTGSSSLVDWCTDAETAPYSLWRDPKIKGTTAELAANKAKSIFDPCPYGWQLPGYTSWDNFIRGTTAINTNRGLGWSTPVAGLRYWPGTGTAAGVVYYLPAGYRSNTGTLTGLSTMGLCASSTPSASGGRTVFYYTSSQIQTAATNYGRAMATSVRCVKISAH